MSIKKAIFILIGIGLIGVIALSFLGNGNPEMEYTTVKAEVGDIIQTVAETGTVKSNKEIDLSFLNTGKLAKLNYGIGAEVKAGTVLAELDYADLNISKQEAEANVEAARQKLNKLLSGATREEIAIARASYDQAKSGYQAAVSDLERTRATANENIRQAEDSLFDLQSSQSEDLTATEQAVQSARTSLENTKVIYQQAIDNARDSGLITVDNKLSVARSALDAVDGIINDEDLEDYLSVSNTDHIQATELSYGQALDQLASARQKLVDARATSSLDVAMAVLDKASAALARTFAALTNCFLVLDNTQSSIVLSQTSLDALKSTISSQQTSVASGQSSVETARQGLNDAILNYNTQVASAQDSLASAQAAYNDALIAAQKAVNSAQLNGEQQISAAEARVNTAEEAMKVAEAQYEDTIAPPNPHDTALARAQLRQAQAALSAIENRIENSRIIAPIDGQITKVEYEAGEQIMSGSPALSMLGENNFEIEVLISEADIAKVKVGDPAVVDLDAFGEDVELPGKIIFVEPAETVIQDVIYYRVNVSFEPGDLEVKSGMTANVTITTAEKRNVLACPSRAIVDKNGEGRFIRVMTDSGPVERKVTTGLRGDGGVIEIIDGIEPGMEVVTYVKEVD